MRRMTSSFAIAVFLALSAQSMPASAEPLHDSLLSGVNAYRASRGLPTVTASPTLQAAAQFMAENVATRRLLASAFPALTVEYEGPEITFTASLRDRARVAA